jgi:C-terminal processing protease CtpA/Prc
MKMWKVMLPVAALLLLAGQAAAQTDDEERLREMEAKEAEMEAREAEMEERLREAEAQMEEAARTIAEITKERLPEIMKIESRFAMANTPRIGITIESTDEPGPVEGVKILGVSPGSAASDAGLRSGDILTSVNSESLGGANCGEANERLMHFMKGVEEGDVLKVEYLREGKVGSVELEPRIMSERAFVWMDKGPKSFSVPPVHLDPEAMKQWKMEFAFPWAGSGLADLELVELNDGLGRYFGTDKGLLVVSAPESEAFKLREGDVIQSIDGREPKDVRHAMRILSSYQAGEKLTLGIMRDKKKTTIDVELPADHHGNLMEQFDIEVRPASAPAAPRAPVAVRPLRPAPPVEPAQTTT